MLALPLRLPTLIVGLMIFLLSTFNLDIPISYPLSSELAGPDRAWSLICSTTPLPLTMQCCNSEFFDIDFKNHLPLDLLLRRSRGAMGRYQGTSGAG